MYSNSVEATDTIQAIHALLTASPTRFSRKKLRDTNRITTNSTITALSTAKSVKLLDPIQARFRFSLEIRNRNRVIVRPIEYMPSIISVETITPTNQTERSFFLIP